MGVSAGRPPKDKDPGTPFNPGHLELSLYLLPSRAALAQPPPSAAADALAGSCVKVIGQLQAFPATEEESARDGAGVYVFDLKPALRSQAAADGWTSLVVDLRTGAAALESKAAVGLSLIHI